MKNRFCEIMGIEKPIMLAPMIYVCDADLAAAVCNAGGLGMLGMNCHVDYPEADPVKNGENLRAEIKKLRTLTDKPFAVNYIPELKGTDPQLSYAIPFKKIILEEKVPVVLINGYIDNGTTADDIEEFKKAGVKVIFKQVNLDLDSYKEAVRLGADAIVVTGTDGGGHTSLAPMSLIAALPRTTDAITEVPVVAGGGIVSLKSAKAASVMGAEALYIGTYFMVAKECRTHPNFKQKLIDYTGENILVWRSSIERMSSTDNIIGKTCSAMASGGATANDIGKNYMGLWNKSMLHGDVEHGIVSFSSACGDITSEKTAKEIVDELSEAFL